MGTPMISLLSSGNFIPEKEHDLVVARSPLKNLHTSHHGTSERNRKNESERIRINISGKIFETYKNTLTSKVESIFNLDNVINYFDPIKNEYYFDRNPNAFEAIFEFMQCGILHQPEKVPFKVFIEDLQFFGFGNEAFKIFSEGRKVRTQPGNEASRNAALDFIWNVFEYPETNVFSQIVSMFSMIMIMLAICLFSVATVPQIKSNKDSVLLLTRLEYICVAWFTFEVAVRLISSPSKLLFIRNVMNLIDLVSLIPYYVEIILHNRASSKVVLSSLRILRMARVFNLLKLYRYSRAMRIIGETVHSSYGELFLLCFFVGIMTMLFSPVIYFLECNDTDDENPFKSIPHVFWFSVVTMTSVGYGDIIPTTIGGRLTTSFLSSTTFMTFALLIPIIGANFTRLHKKILSDSPEYRFNYDHNLSTKVAREEVIVRETDL